MGKGDGGSGYYKPLNTLNGPAAPIAATSTGTFYGTGGPAPKRKPLNEMKDGPSATRNTRGGTKAKAVVSDIDDDTSTDENPPRKRRKRDDSAFWSQDLVRIDNSSFFNRKGVKERRNSANGNANAKKVMAMKRKSGAGMDGTDSKKTVGDFPSMEFRHLLVGEKVMKERFDIRYHGGKLTMRQNGRDIFSIPESQITNLRRSAPSKSSGENLCFVFSTANGFLGQGGSAFKQSYHGDKGVFMKTPQNQVICITKSETDLNIFCSALTSKIGHLQVKLEHLSAAEEQNKNVWLDHAQLLNDTTSSNDEATAEVQVDRARPKRRVTQNSRATASDAEDFMSIEITPPDARASSRLKRKKIDPAEELFSFQTIVLRGEDYGRLDDGQFLNDSVIELQLKRIYEELPPELKEATYMFNSFFYQQLSTDPKGKRDPVAMHQRVKRWTSKVDLFSKRFIIVPINESLHWYLAIISNPAAILTGGSEADPGPIDETEPTQRPSLAVLNLDSSDNEDEMDTRLPVVDKPATVTDELDQLIRATNAKSKDGNGHNGIDKDLPEFAAVDHETVPLVGGKQKSLEVNGDENVRSPAPAAELQADKPEGFFSLIRTGVLNVIQSLTTSREASPVRNQEDGGGTAQEKPEEKPEEKVGEPAREPVVEPTTVQTTETALTTSLNLNRGYIFQFDSLGSKGNEVGQILNSYLRQEALVKKHIEVPDNARLAHVHAINVPKQTNHSDCGIYLLKYVQMFLSDPAKYTNIILDKTTMPPKEVKALWFTQQEARKLRSDLREFFDLEMAKRKSTLEAASAQAAVGTAPAGNGAVTNGALPQESEINAAADESVVLVE